MHNRYKFFFADKLNFTNVENNHRPVVRVNNTNTVSKRIRQQFDATQLTDYMYVGNISNGHDIIAHVDHKIALVVNLIENTPTEQCSKQSTTKYVCYPFEDRANADILGVLAHVLPLIASTILQEKKVLVHCYAGISRSVSVCIAYLMIVNGESFEKTSAYVESQRKDACPNFGFIFALETLCERPTEHLRQLRNILLDKTLSDDERQTIFAQVFTSI